MKITEVKLRRMIRGVIREFTSSTGGGPSDNSTDAADAESANEPTISSTVSKGSAYWYTNPAGKGGSQDGKPAKYKVSDWGKKDAKAAKPAVPAKKAVPANPKKGTKAQAAVAFQPAQKAQAATSGHNAYSSNQSAAKDTDSPWVTNPDYSDWEDSMADAEAADAETSTQPSGGQGDPVTGGSAGASTGGKKGKKKKDDK